MRFTRTLPSPPARLALPVAFLAAAGLASAQEAAIHLSLIEWLDEGPGTTGDFERIRSGDFNSDKLADVAIQRGDALITIPGADVYRTLHIAPDPSDTPNPIAVNDFDVLKGASKDSLAVVGAGGLRLLTLAAEPNTWSETLLDTSAWAGATLVRCDDLNFDGDDDIFGVAANGTDVLTMMSDGQGGHAPGPSFPSPATVVDLAGIEWRSTGIKEIVTLTTGGYRIRDLQTTEITYRDSPLWRDAIAVLPGVAGALDRLAWVTGHPNGTDTILLVTHDGGDEPSIVIPNRQATAAGAGDLDGDEAHELVLRYADGDLYAFDNMRDAGYQGPSSFGLTDADNDLIDADTFATPPHVADLAGNGYGDVLAMGDGLKEVVLYYRDTAAPSSPYYDAGPIFEVGISTFSADPYTADPGLLTTAFDYFGDPAWGGMFEVAIHKQAELGLPTVPDVTYYLPGVTVGSQTHWSVSIPIPYEGDSRWNDGMSVVNHLVLRPVTLSGTEIVWAGPPQASAFLAESNHFSVYPSFLDVAPYPYALRAFCQYNVPSWTLCPIGSGATPVGGQVGESGVPPGN